MLLRFAALFFLIYTLWRWWKPARRSRVTKRGFQKGRGKSPWQVLGVAPGSDEKTLRRAYQDLLQQYHPDKVATLGPEIQKLAHEKTREINDAYHQLKPKNESS